MFEYRAKLIDVVDADTIRVRVDLGCDVHVDLTMQLWEVVAVRSQRPEAKAWVLDWFDAYAPDGDFLVTTVKNRREKFGRYQGIVASLDRQRVCNRGLVEAGLASSVPHDPAVAVQSCSSHPHS